MVVNRLKTLRLARNIKQADLAKLLSVSQSTISGWESGRYEIDHYNLCKLADYFDVSIDYLLDHMNSDQNSYDKSNDLKKILDKELVYFEDNVLTSSDKELIRQILQRFFSSRTPS